jgi:hypothetical protein
MKRKNCLSTSPRAALVIRKLAGVLGFMSVTAAFLAAHSTQETQPDPSGQLNRSRRFGPNACGPADPVYIRMANETGGLPMFLQRSEAGKAIQLMRESTGENRVTMLWARGRLPDAPHEFTVPVDSTVERTTFSLSTDTKGTSMTVLRPSGEPVAPGAGIEITELNCGRVVTVASPDAGDWRVQVTGSGRFWIEVQGKSEIFFVNVEFVRVGGRPGHEGYFRIPGQPLAGQPATLEVSLSRLARNAGFELVTEAGNTIESVQMHHEGSGDESEYYGSFELPDQPFRLAVRGHDEKGNTYQRYFHTLFHAENVEVVPQFTATEDLPPGKTTTLTYTVRNVGPPTTFRILAVDGRHFLTRVEPRELTLETGASANVEVDLTVPAEAQAGSGTDVTLTATSTSDPANTNGSSKHLSVFAAAPATPRPDP